MRKKKKRQPTTTAVERLVMVTIRQNFRSALSSAALFHIHWFSEGAFSSECTKCIYTLQFRHIHIEPKQCQALNVIQPECVCFAKHAIVCKQLFNVYVHITNLLSLVSFLSLVMVPQQGLQALLTVCYKVLLRPFSSNAIFIKMVLNTTALPYETQIRVLCCIGISNPQMNVYMWIVFEWMRCELHRGVYISWTLRIHTTIEQD